MKLVMNDTRKAVIAVLKASQAPMTLAEISAAVGFEVKTGSTNAMVTAGVIAKAGEREVAKVVKSKVATYAIGSKTVEQVEKFNATPERKAILDVLANATEPMTLAEISNAVGFAVKSGTTNTMVSKDLIVKAGEKTVEKAGKGMVATYELGATDPEAAQA